MYLSMSFLILGFLFTGINFSQLMIGLDSKVSIYNAIFSFCILMFLIYFRKIKVKFSFYFVVVSFFVLLCIIFSFVFFDSLTNKSFPLQFLRGYVLFSMFYLAVINNFFTKEDVYKLFFFSSVICAMFGFMQIVFLYLGLDPKMGVDYPTYLRFDDADSFYVLLGFPMFRVSSFLGDPNYFAFAMLPGLCVASGWLIDGVIRKKSTAVCLVLVLLIFFLTLSRGAILGLLVFIVSYIFFESKSKSLFKKLAIVIIFSSVGLLLTMGGRSSNAQGSTNERMSIYQNGLDKVLQSPFGIGDSLVNVERSLLSTHNLLLEGGLSFGYVFFILYALVFVFYLMRSVNAKSGISYLFSLVVASMFLELLIYPQFWMYLVLIYLKTDKHQKKMSHTPCYGKKYNQ
ncbi:O-antigen ligase family protein [Iodobacter sp. CM08]|uniref:O-antigen ligase family protein n=1 Tax=Iodobacter sp. CM08 TaxID=3085902 RepID=UPI00298181C4|nr:O-antigen ligase family protein [Iodobacter sp. CM08]MDW5416975.1 O-antigen ligase family protein [Iodobacter sp. CM08]